jgi:hypothetical protein
MVVDMNEIHTPQVWEETGLIYVPKGLHGFDHSHCHKPTPLLILDGKTIRIYFGTRDHLGKTRTTFVDVDEEDPSRVLYIHDRPVLDLGKLGVFDDSGVNVCSVLRVGDLIYMYFIGWNPGTTVHTRNAIGLAVSDDGGLTFNRLYDGAVLDRTKEEPYYTGAVDVMPVEDGFWAWYTSGSEWKIVNGKPEIFYHIKWASSLDGVDWSRSNITCIPPANPFEATARPSVIYENGLFHMWYSRRDLRGFRENPNMGYAAGYAISTDGINWDRRDSQVTLERSDEGWDSDAVAYPYVLDIGKRWLLFCNGNGFGKTGMGYAILERQASFAHVGKRMRPQKVEEW